MTQQSDRLDRLEQKVRQLEIRSEALVQTSKQDLNFRGETDEGRDDSDPRESQ